MQREFKPKNKFQWTAEERAEARLYAKANSMTFGDLRKQVVGLHELTTEELGNAVMSAAYEARQKNVLNLQDLLDYEQRIIEATKNMTDDEKNERLESILDREI